MASLCDNEPQLGPQDPVCSSNGVRACVGHLSGEAKQLGAWVEYEHFTPTELGTQDGLTSLSTGDFVTSPELGPDVIGRVASFISGKEITTVPQEDEGDEPPGQSWRYIQRFALVLLGGAAAPSVNLVQLMRKGTNTNLTKVEDTDGESSMEPWSSALTACRTQLTLSLRPHMNPG